MRLAPSRKGFTLLEVILAVTIALLLLGGLYVAMDAQLRQMEEGRDIVENSSTARQLFVRITQDLTPSVGALQPVSTSSSSSTSSSASTGASTTPTTTTTATPGITFQLGVVGDADRVAIFRTRLSRATINPPADANGNVPPPQGDVSRVTYFMTADGLARQEIVQPTSERTDDLPSDKDEFTKILANEVKDLKFRYYDGTTWQESWDGATPGPDGVTPQGPPAALEITVTLQLRGSDAPRPFRHVIAFQTASGPPSTDSQTGTTTP